MEIGAQFSQSDIAETGEEKRFSFIEGAAQRRVDRLFDEAAGGFRTVANRQKRRAAESVVNVAE